MHDELHQREQLYGIRHRWHTLNALATETIFDMQLPDDGKVRFYFERSSKERLTILTRRSDAEPVLFLNNKVLDYNPRPF
jgi:hypothetical protein